MKVNQEFENISQVTLSFENPPRICKYVPQVRIFPNVLYKFLKSDVYALKGSSRSSIH